MKELVPFNGPTEGIGDFFDFLWGDQTGYAYLATKDRALDDKDPKSFRKNIFEWPLKKDEVIAYVLARNAQGLDVYMCPAVYGESAYEARSSNKEHVKGSYVLWADFDGNAPASWDTPVSEQEPVTGALLADPARVPPPTVRIKSSLTGHEHCYWRLDNFCTDKELIETLNRGIAYKYGADKGGWDINQVLRPPHTTNYKRKQPVVVEASIDKVYNLDTFKAFKDERQIAFDATVPELTDVPPVEWVIAHYKFEKADFDFFMQPSVEEGKRSSALMKLGYFGAESGMTEMEIYALLDNADKRWGKFTGRHNRDWYLLDIVGKAMKKHPVGGDEGLFRNLIGEVAAEETPELILSWNDFNRKEYKFEWIAEGLLERQGMTLLASAPGLGKTQLSLQFALCAALGRKFLVWDIPKPMKILFYSLEMHGAALQLFTHQMATRYTEEEIAAISENLLILPEYDYLPLDREEGKIALQAMIEEHQPDGIILDSMGKLTGESLSDEKKAKQLNRYYSSLRRSYNIFIWFVHHNRKANGDNKQPKDLQDVYGNQYIAADITSALSLWQGVDGLELNVIKSRLSKMMDTIPILRTDTLHFELSEDTIRFDNLVRGGNDGTSQDGKFDI